MAGGYEARLTAGTELIDLLRSYAFEPAPPGTYEVLGRYTPAEELRDRLNARARGETPGDPINWKGLP